MKKHILAAAFFLAALLMSGCQENTSVPGKAYDELPALQADELWAVFCAIPESVLPDYLKTAGRRSAFRQKFNEMQEGVLGDGEGIMDKWAQSDNSIFWSDYFTKPDEDDWSLTEDEHTSHPYVNMHAYQGAGGAKVFAVVQLGSYADGEENKEPDKYYWYDKKSGKISEARLKLDKQYTDADLTEDPLLLYGSENLFYAIRNKQYYPTYCDRGLKIYIEDVGMSGVMYEWDGSMFRRNTTDGSTCLYNYGFGSIAIGDSVPFSVPGYITEEAGYDGPYEALYKLTRDGEDGPTLIFHADPEIKVTGIEVCKPGYNNIYSIHPGMKVSEFMKIVADINSGYDEPTYTSVVEGKDFIEIYTGFDEDFVYMVSKDDYLGEEQLKPEATIARVMLTNAVG